jgi:hypothetical protein
MLEIDVSFLLHVEASLFSASQAELGPNAGKITWANACENCHLIHLTPEEILEAKEYIRTWGAWDGEEIDSWSEDETKALIVQSAAGDYREALSCCRVDEDFDDIEWDEYLVQAESGRISGNLFMHDGKLYMSFCG